MIKNALKSEKLTWESTEEKDHEQQTQGRKRPNDENDPPRSERSRQYVIQLISPIPQRSHPNLLRTLNDTSTENPNFCGSPSLFTEVETEEGETSGGCHGVRPGRNIGEDIVCGEQTFADVGKSDEEEGDAEEEPGEGKDPDGRLEAEQHIPNDGSTEEHRANDIQSDTRLPVGSRKQDDLVTGRAQHLSNGQLLRHARKEYPKGKRTCPNAKMIPYNGQPKSSRPKNTCSLDGMTKMVLESP